MSAHSAVASHSEGTRIADQQQVTAKNTVVESTTDSQGVARIIIKQETPPYLVSELKAQTPKDDKISTKAIISTLLGAGAGAAVAYAMAKSEEDKVAKPQPKTLVYRTVNSRIDQNGNTAIIIESSGKPTSIYDSQRRAPVVYETTPSYVISRGPRAESVASSYHSRKESGAEIVRSAPSVDGSRTGRTLVQTQSTKILAGPLPSSKPSRMGPPSATSAHSRGTKHGAAQSPPPALSTVRERSVKDGGLSSRPTTAKTTTSSHHGKPGAASASPSTRTIKIIKVATDAPLPPHSAKTVQSVQSARDIPLPSSAPETARASRASTTKETARLPPSTANSIKTTRTARDIPLPPSAPPSVPRDVIENDLEHLEGTIVPDDSISQVSTNDGRSYRRDRNTSKTSHDSKSYRSYHRHRPRRSE